jgi:phosphoglycerate dehydrogenase-like enzyme
MSKHRPTIALFTSISDIAPALRKAAPSLPLLEIVDEALGGYGGTVEFHASKIQKETKTQLAAAEILITEPVVLAALLQHMTLPNLIWCQSTYAGVDPLFAASNQPMPRSFTLTRFAGKFGPPIAEWCLARIIGHERKFDLTRRDQSAKEWAASKQVLQYRYLSDLTLTVLGCGDIGLCIARAAKAFGMRVVGYARSDNKSDPALDDCVTCLTTALRQADYVVSVLPSTGETRGLLTEEVFSLASKEKGGKSPVFINVGRGDVTDTKTLCTALDKGYLEAAILDVFEQEPLPDDNPLWSHLKVTLSPHVSGLTRGQDVPNLVLDNYDRYINQKPLLYEVDWGNAY